MIYAYNYASGGFKATDGMEVEVNARFMPNEGQKPAWAPWKAENSLFGMKAFYVLVSQRLMKVTWMGINDVRFLTELDPSLNVFFRHEETLYDSGARRFLFFDLPPMERCPLGASSHLMNPANRKVSRRAGGPVSANGIASCPILLIILHELILVSMPRYFPHTTISWRSWIMHKALDLLITFRSAILVNVCGVKGTILQPRSIRCWGQKFLPF